MVRSRNSQRCLAKAKAESLLSVLRQIKDQQPELKENGTKAVFKIKAPVNGKEEIGFSKIGKFWYIDN
jgi:hypothetical protein